MTYEHDIEHAIQRQLEIERKARAWDYMVNTDRLRAQGGDHDAWVRVHRAENILKEATRA